MAHPDQIDGHRVLGVLGEGGMGIVFRVQRPGEGEMALKVIRGKLSQLSRLRFAREFRVASCLVHPAFVKVFEIGLYEGNPYYTMELVTGTTLDRYLKTAPQELLRRLGESGAQVLDALAYLHSQGIVHRDLKPANVLVDAQGQVRILDFGLARADSSKRLTVDGAVVGTMDYISPEQLVGGDIDGRTDLYSWGAMCYEALSGHLPFGAPTFMARYRQILAEPPVALLDRCPSLDPRLTELIERLLRKEPSERYSHAPDVQSRWQELFSLEVSPPQAPGGVFEPRLVGREPLLQRLSAGLDGLQAGKGAAYLVEGPLGSGKSRLLRELARMAAGSGLQTSWGVAHEEDEPPYSLWKELLKDSVVQGLPSDLEPFRSVLTLVLPELAGSEQTMTEPVVRFQLFEGMLRLLRHLCLSHGHLLLLEDVQWADPSSLAFLGYVLRSLEKAPAALMVVLSLRDESRPDVTHDVRALPTERLHVDPLNCRQCQAMIGSMLGSGDVDPSLAEQLHQESEGNPLFLNEMVKQLSDQGNLRLLDGSWKAQDSEGLPSTMAAVIQSRLADLAPAQLALLQRAAVLGRTFDFEVLEALAGQDGAQTLDLVEELLQRTILVEARQLGFFAFYHNKIRDVVMQGIPAEELRVLHERAAQILGSQPGETKIFEVAHHLQKAGLAEQAALALLKAAERAAQAHAGQETADCYQAMLDLGAPLPLPLPEIQRRQAEALFEAGLPRQSLDRLQGLFEHIPGPPLTRASLHRLAGACWDELGGYEQAEASLKNGLAELGIRTRPGAGTALRLLGVLIPTLGTLTYPKDPARASEIEALCHRLVHVQFFSRSPHWEMQTLDFTCHQLLAAMASGHYDLSPRSRFILGHLMLHGPAWLAGFGTGLVGRAAQLAERLEEGPMRSMLLRQSGYLLHEAGEASRGAELASQAEALSDKIGDLLGLAESRLILASIYAYWGFIERARSLAESALETARSCEHRTVMMLSPSTLCQIACLRGEGAEARHWLEALQESRSNRTSAFVEMVGGLVESWVLLGEHQPNSAVEVAREARKLCRKVNGGRFYTHQLVVREVESLLAQAHLDRSGRPGLLNDAQAALRQSPAQGLPWKAQRLRLAGEIEALRGHDEEARRSLGLALELLEKCGGAPLEQARTHLTLARLPGAPAGQHEEQAHRLQAAANQP